MSYPDEFSASPSMRMLPEHDERGGDHHVVDAHLSEEWFELDLFERTANITAFQPIPVVAWGPQLASAADNSLPPWRTAAGSAATSSSRMDIRDTQRSSQQQEAATPTAQHQPARQLPNQVEELLLAPGRPRGPGTEAQPVQHSTRQPTGNVVRNARKGYSRLLPTTRMGSLTPSTSSPSLPLTEHYSRRSRPMPVAWHAANEAADYTMLHPVYAESGFGTYLRSGLATEEAYGVHYDPRAQAAESPTPSLQRQHATGTATPQDAQAHVTITFFGAGHDRDAAQSFQVFSVSSETATSLSRLLRTVIQSPPILHHMQ